MCIVFKGLMMQGKMGILTKGQLHIIMIIKARIRRSLVINVNCLRYLDPENWGFFVVVFSVNRVISVISSRLFPLYQGKPLTLFRYRLVSLSQ